MKTAEVIDMNDKILQNIGARIDAAYRRVRESDTSWVEGSLELMQALREGRDRFPADQAFGQWLKDGGHDHVSDHHRAALLGMSTDMDIAREVLAQTDRRSYRMIWDEVKGRFDSAAKPRRTTKQTSSDKPPRKSGLRLAPEVEKKVSKDVLDEGLSYTEAAAKNNAGGKTVVEKVVERELARRETITEMIGEAGAEHYNEKGKLRIEDAIKVTKANLAKNFNDKVEEEVRARIEKREQYERQENIKLREENRILRSALMQKAVFTPLEFKRLLMCVHPDNSASADVRNEMLSLLNKHETRLVKPTEGVKVKPSKRPVGSIFSKIDEAMSQ